MDTAPSTTILLKNTIQPGKFEDPIGLLNNSRIWAASHLAS